MGKLGLFLIAVSFAFPQANAGTGRHYMMGSMGDSITVAFMADTSVTPGPGFLPSRVISSPEIDRAFAQLNQLEQTSFDNRWKLSWSSGSDIQSQYVLLQNYLRKTEPLASLEVRNVAVSGALTSDLLDQADQIVRSALEFDSVEYLTILIGANDACHDTANSEMEQSLLQVFAKLNAIRQAEPIRILVSGIPKIPDLGTRAIDNSTGFAGLSCKVLRNRITRTCLSLVYWNSIDDYNAKVAYVADKNLLLKKVVLEANQKFPNLQIVFSDKIFDLTLGAGDLASECFHPNAKAQQKISQTLWPVQPWFH